MKELTIEEFIPGFEFMYLTSSYPDNKLYWSRYKMQDCKGKFIVNIENVTKKWNEDKSRFKRLE